MKLKTSKKEKKPPLVAASPFLPTKNKRGRPPKYTPEWIDAEAENLEEWIKKDEAYYLGDFCLHQGYHRNRLLDFEKDSQRFSDALKLAKQYQECKFIRKGLSKEWDSSFARYVMARVCGDIWKASYDKEEGDKDIIQNITINELR